METRYSKLVKQAAADIKLLDSALDKRIYQFVREIYALDGIDVKDYEEDYCDFVRDWILKCGNPDQLLKLYKLNLLELRKARIEDEIKSLEDQTK